MTKSILKTTSIFGLIVFFSSNIWAQESPATSSEGSVNGVKIKIDYHSPKVKERIIWGGLEQYDKVWRTGANEATTIEVSENVNVGSSVYVTTFPCINCARLLAEAGVKKVYYRDGYSRLDAETILKDKKVEIVLVQDVT